MLKLSISLVTQSSGVIVVPENLKKKYLELRTHEKAVENALRSFRSPPNMPEHLKGFSYNILDLMTEPDSPNGYRVEASRDRIVKLGNNGRTTPYKTIKFN